MREGVHQEAKAGEMGTMTEHIVSAPTDFPAATARPSTIVVVQTLVPE